MNTRNQNHHNTTNQEISYPTYKWNANIQQSLLKINSPPVDKLWDKNVHALLFYKLGQHDLGPG